MRFGPVGFPLSKPRIERLLGPSLQLETSRSAGHRVLVARGEIDIKTAPELDAALAGHASEALILDVAAVAFIDSTGLHVLTSARSRSIKAGGRLVLSTPQDTPVLRTLGLAGLATDFEIISSPDDLTPG